MLLLRDIHLGHKAPGRRMIMSLPEHTQEEDTCNHNSIRCFDSKSPLQAIELELQQGYTLSPIEAQVLAQRILQIINERAGNRRSLGQIAYKAIAMDEPPGKHLRDCRKVSVHLTLYDEDDSRLLANQGSVELSRVRVHRLVHDSLIQGGALSQEDLACLMGVS